MIVYAYQHILSTIKGAISNLSQPIFDSFSCWIPPLNDVRKTCACEYCFVVDILRPSPLENGTRARERTHRHLASDTTWTIVGELQVIFSHIRVGHHVHRLHRNQNEVYLCSLVTYVYQDIPKFNIVHALVLGGKSQCSENADWIRLDSVPTGTIPGSRQKGKNRQYVSRYCDRSHSSDFRNTQRSQSEETVKLLWDSESVCVRKLKIFARSVTRSARTQQPK